MNAKMQWQPGTRLTADRLTGIQEEMHRSMKMLFRTMDWGVIGLLPNEEFICNPLFSKGTLGIERLRGMAYVGKGNFLDIDERVEIPFPSLITGEYFLTAGLGDGEVLYQERGMDYARPKYEFSILNYDEVVAKENLLPIVKMKVENNMVKIDENFIPPCFLIRTDERILTQLEDIKERVRFICKHPHLVPSIVKDIVDYYSARLLAISSAEATCNLQFALQEYILALEYDFLMTKDDDLSKWGISSLNVIDINRLMQSVVALQKQVIGILDATEPKDDSIDIEKLKSEIKEDLYGQLKQSLSEELYKELREKIEEELTASLYEKIKGDLDADLSAAADRLESTLRDSLQAALRESLRSQLHEDLYQPLYDDLYAELYKALLAVLMPVEEERNEFMPDI